MYLSVRCHAVITAEGIYKNAVISYEGERGPVYAEPVSIMADHISVRSFAGEIHSTVDYNGIAVAGCVDMPNIKLTVDNLPTYISQIKISKKNPVEVLQFIPLQSCL